MKAGKTRKAMRCKRVSKTRRELSASPDWLAVAAKLNEEQLRCVQEVKYPGADYLWGQCQACKKFVHGIEHYGDKHARKAQLQIAAHTLVNSVRCGITPFFLVI